MRAQRNKAISRMGKTLLVFTLGILLVYLPIAAQEDPGPAQSTPKPKSEFLALSLSLFGTLIPWSLVSARFPINSAAFKLTVAGCLIGPSLGYFYAGLWGRALSGIGLRTLAGAACAAGIALGVVALFESLFGTASSGGTALAAVGLTVIGGAVYFGSALKDISSVKSAVWERNQRLQGKKLSFAPFYIPASKTAGLQVQFSF